MPTFDKVAAILRRWRRRSHRPPPPEALGASTFEAPWVNQTPESSQVNPDQNLPDNSIPDRDVKKNQVQSGNAVVPVVQKTLTASVNEAEEFQRECATSDDDVSHQAPEHLPTSPEQSQATTSPAPLPSATTRNAATQTPSSGEKTIEESPRACRKTSTTAATQFPSPQRHNARSLLLAARQEARDEARLQAHQSARSKEIDRGHLKFQGDTYIHDPDLAVYHSDRAINSPNIIRGRLQLVYFTDGSRTQTNSKTHEAAGLTNIFRPGGFGIVSKVPGGADNDGKQWLHEAYDAPRLVSACQAELLGIAEATAKALSYMEKHNLHGACVRIFSDSMESIRHISHGFHRAHSAEKNSDYTGGDFAKDYQYIRPILVCLAKLSEGIAQRNGRLEIRWVKRESSGQQRGADALSRVAWEKSDRHRLLTPRAAATADLDRQVELAVEEAWKSAKIWGLELPPAPRTPRNLREAQAEMLARVIELRRMQRVSALCERLKLELAQKEYVVGHLLT